VNVLYAWEKGHNTSGVGPGLLRKLKIAVPEKNEHGCILKEMENSLPASAIAAWKEQVELWESDNERTNPFEVTVKSELPRVSGSRYLMSSSLLSDNTARCPSRISSTGS
jgi:hypothetical protein